MDWVDLAQNRDRLRALVSAVMNILFLKTTENFLTSLETVSSSAKTLLRQSVSCLVSYTVTHSVVNKPKINNKLRGFPQSCHKIKYFE